MQVFHEKAAGRLNIGEHGDFRRQPIKIGQLQRNVQSARNSEQVQDRIRRAADRRDHTDGVLKGRARQDT